MGEQPEIPEQDVRSDWLKGKVVRVSDGDTVVLLVDEDGPKQIRVRLEGIDAPESGQPWGKRATQYLADLIHGETVEVLSIGEDRYVRLLGRIYIGEDDQRLDVNHALVARVESAEGSWRRRQCAGPSGRCQRTTGDAELGRFCRRRGQPGGIVRVAGSDGSSSELHQQFGSRLHTLASKNARAHHAMCGAAARWILAELRPGR